MCKCCVQKKKWKGFRWAHGLVEALRKSLCDTISSKSLRTNFPSELSHGQKFKTLIAMRRHLTEFNWTDATESSKQLVSSFDGMCVPSRYSDVRGCASVYYIAAIGSTRLRAIGPCHTRDIWLLSCSRDLAAMRELRAPPVISDNKCDIHNNRHIHLSHRYWFLFSHGIPQINRQYQSRVNRWCMCECVREREIVSTRCEWCLYWTYKNQDEIIVTPSALKWLIMN